MRLVTHLPRLLTVAATLLILVVVAVVRPVAPADAHLTGPGGALAISSGPKEGVAPAMPSTATL